MTGNIKTILQNLKCKIESEGLATWIEEDFADDFDILNEYLQVSTNLKLQEVYIILNYLRLAIHEKENHLEFFNIQIASQEYAWDQLHLTDEDIKSIK